jgi:flagellin-like protein
MVEIQCNASGKRPPSDRGLSSVVGVVLLVAIVIVTAAVVGLLSMGTAEQLDQPSPLDAQLSLEPDSAGTSAFVRSVQSPVEVRIDGETIYTVTPSDSGEELFLPTAPGDTVTVVSTGSKQELLLQQTVDPASGDYMLSYPLTAGSGTAVSDRSAHENDAELGELDGSGFSTGTGSHPSWVDTGEETALRFDGQTDAARTNGVQLEEEDQVDEFTIAVKFNSRGSTGGVQQIVEHSTENEPVQDWAWYFETDGGNAGGPDEFAVDYEVHWPSATVATTDPLKRGNTHVLVGTYDGEELDLYVNGSAQVTGKELSSSLTADPAQMGDLWVGADIDCRCQHFDGDMYEVRLYYTALDDDEVEQVSTAMMHSSQ